MTNRQLAALETRKKLLEAAKKIVCEKGLINTSIEEITKACGVSNGTFYTYFKRKEDVIFALSREVYQEPDNIVILGATRITRFLLYSIPSKDRKRIRLVEKDENAANEFAALFPEIRQE